MVDNTHPGSTGGSLQPGDDRDLRIAELEKALKRSEIAMEIVSQTNSLLDRELFKSTIVAKVGEIAADILNYDRMADRLLELIGRVVDYDIAGLLLLQSSRPPLGLRVCRHAEGRLADSFAASMLAAVTDETDRAIGEAECRRSVLSCELARGGDRAINPEIRIRSFHCVVLRIGDEPLGMLAIGSATADAFGSGEIESFELIASQSSIVVDDAARHQALAVSRRRIEELHDTARTLESCETSDAVFATALEALQGMFEAVDCFIDVVEGERLVCRATTVDTGKDDGPSDVYLAQVGVEAEALVRDETVVFDPTGDVPEQRAPNGFRSGLAVPIGDTAVMLVLSSLIRVNDDDSVRLVELLAGHITEAIERIRLRDELRAQAIHDPLTGAYNRRHFEEALRVESARARRSGEAIGFLMIDVDSFKQINDTYGHDVGDRVLVGIVQTLRACTREADLVVRSGGDEFIVVMPGIGASLDVPLGRVTKSMEDWNDASGFDFRVGLSIGCMRWDPTTGDTIEDSLKQADDRMYEEKRRRKAGGGGSGRCAGGDHQTDGGRRADSSRS